MQNDFMTTELKVGDFLEVCSDCTGVEKSNSCEITLLNSNNIWLKYPENTKSKIMFHEGKKIRVISPAPEGVLIACTIMIGTRRTDTGTIFVIEHPKRWTFQKRRLEKRVNVELDVLLLKFDEFGNPSKCPITAKVVNLSKNGARILARAPFGAGERLIIDFSAQDSYSSPPILGQVVRIITTTPHVNKATEFGVRFLRRMGSQKDDDLSLAA